MPVYLKVTQIAPARIQTPSITACDGVTLHGWHHVVSCLKYICFCASCQQYLYLICFDWILCSTWWEQKTELSRHMLPPDREGWGREHEVPFGFNLYLGYLKIELFCIVKRVMRCWHATHSNSGADYGMPLCDITRCPLVYVWNHWP